MAERVEEGEPGDFYVKAECCIICGVPPAIAPDLFHLDEEKRQCWVKKQPKTPAELDRMAEVLWNQDIGCIRYGGKDPELLRRLEKADLAAYCDALPKKKDPPR
jgi:ferredoxin